MISSLTLGSKIFSSNLIQGPLAGISCAPFRLLTWRESKPAFTYTEMISCKTVLHQPQLTLKRYLTKAVAEGPVCFQLAGNDPNELAEATRRVTDYGADLIDLNCGCPVKKIRQKGAGSRLLTNLSTLYDLICAMKQNTHVPVSIKIRVQGNSDEKFHADLIKVVEDAGPDFIVVHGRHWTEHYETPCHYEQIRYFVENLDIPVIGNGDVSDIFSLKKMLATGCAGVMIARAGVGQPWLIHKLANEILEKTFSFPEVSAIGLLLMEHIKLLAELLQSDKFAILQARKFAKYYARNLIDKAEFNIALNKCDNLREFELISKKYFKIFCE